MKGRGFHVSYKYAETFKLSNVVAIVYVLTLDALKHLFSALHPSPFLHIK